MNKKLPKVYVNKFNKNLNNNVNVFYSKFTPAEIEEESIILTSIDKNLNIEEKINRMFDSPNYVYKMKAEIIKKDGGIIKKEIVGKINNNLITIDDELIPINDIINIKY